MSVSIFYGFQDPLGADDSKVGITEHPAVRLGVYQNSYSSRSHMAQFDWAYYGEKSVIEKLERTVKKEFDWDIEKDGRGHSEWIWNHTSDMILEKVKDIIEGYHYKVQIVPNEYLPLNMDNLEDFLESLDKTEE